MTCAKVMNPIPIPSGINHYGIVADSNNNRIYVSNYESSNVSVIDTNQNTLINPSDPIPVHTEPNRTYGIAFNSINGNIYVASSDSVAIISGTNVVQTIPNIPGATEIAINPDPQKIYVTDQSHSVILIDGHTNQRVRTIQVGEGPTGIAFNSITKRVYVANTGASGRGNTVSVIEPDDTVSLTIAVGNNPQGIAVSANGDVYVANNHNGSVSVIHGTNNTVSTISLWDIFGRAVPQPGPTRIAYHPNGNLYVANDPGGDGPGSLSVVDSASKRVLAAIPIPGRYLRGIEVVNEKVYLTGANNVFVVKVT